MPVLAVVLPPEADEFQELKIITSVDAVGSLNQESELSWRLSSELLDENLVYGDNPDDPLGEPVPIIMPEPPLNPMGEQQSHVTYSEDTQANVGIISYRKTTEVDTEAQPLGLYNVQNERLITFTGIDVGTILSSEDMAMYNVGTCSPVLFTCLFCNCGCNCGPAFCSKVEAGSDLDMSQVAVHTAGSIRNVNKMGDITTWPNVIPTADEPALLNYLVQVTEMGQGKPSVGSVSTYLKISESDSRSDAFDACNDLMQQLNVEEFTSIRGSISLFEKQMNFESKLEPFCKPVNLE